MNKIDTDDLRWIVTEATPGPWTSSYRGTRRDFANGRDFFRITSADEASDPDATAIVHVQWRNDRAANAALIALAPDLAAEVIAARAPAPAVPEDVDWTTCGIVEIAARNPSVMEYMAHWERRAEAAEAELAQMREQLADAIRWRDHYRQKWLADTSAALNPTGD